MWHLTARPATGFQVATLMFAAYCLTKLTHENYKCYFLQCFIVLRIPIFAPRNFSKKMNLFEFSPRTRHNQVFFALQDSFAKSVSGTSIFWQFCLKFETWKLELA